MEYLKNFIRTHIFDFSIIILNIIYFIPKTIEWLKWDSGITMGYVGIELILNYFIHIFFIYSFISLLDVLEKKYRIYSIIFIMAVGFVSFIFAFRIIGFLVFIPVIVYVFTFYILLRKIKSGKKTENKMSIITFIFSIIWLILNQKYFK